MSHDIAFAMLALAQLLLVLGMWLALIRMLRGPRAQDRILALDALYAGAILLLLSISIRTASMFYVEAALVIALLGFAGSAALAKFLLRGDIIE